MSPQRFVISIYRSASSTSAALLITSHTNASCFKWYKSGTNQKVILTRFNMEKGTFAQLSCHLEAFTQRIVERYPDTKDLSSHLQKPSASKITNYDKVKRTLRWLPTPQRYHQIEIQRKNKEECIASINFWEKPSEMLILIFCFIQQCKENYYHSWRKYLPKRL